MDDWLGDDDVDGQGEKGLGGQAEVEEGLFPPQFRKVYESGYREGSVKGYETGLQEGFDVAFAKGLREGAPLGRLLGALR